MKTKEIVNLVRNYCAFLANQYRQDKDELFSYVLDRLPTLISRMDTKSYTLRQCKAYIKKSVLGYCYHYMRDKAHLIRTPRGCTPYTCQTLLETDYRESNDFIPDIPWYIEQIMEDPNLTQRISNAYLRYLDT